MPLSTTFSQPDLGIHRLESALRSPVGPRVLFFATFVSRESGASHALLQTIRRVEAAGVSPLVVIPDCTASREMFPTDAFDVVYLKIRRPRRTWSVLTHGKYLLAFPPTVRALTLLIREKNIDIVHFNEITDFIAGVAAKSCGVPSVCHVRADPLPVPYRWPMLSILRKTVDAIVVPSKTNLDWISSSNRELAGKTTLIYDYAFDIREYQQPVSGAEFRREMGIPAGEVLVVLVSKLVAPKGHECYIRAAANVRKLAKGVTFVVVGGPVPGHDAEAAAIHGLAKDLFPDGGFRFVGPRSDLPSIYAACDIAVHCPVYPDPYPTVVLLPMLMGKPVVGSNTGGIPEQIDNNETGILVPPNDPSALSDAVLELALNPARRATLGSAAARDMGSRLAAETQGTLLAELYAKIIRNRIPRGRVDSTSVV